MIVSGQTEKMLIERAASKFSGSPSSLVSAAKRELRTAGSWKDEVRLDVWMNKPFVGSRCARLLHGVPSPRFWASPVKNIVRMPAKDVLYFFDPHNLTEALPELYREDDLAHWLGGFSSIRFEDQLIEALIEHTVHVQARAPHWPIDLVYRVIAGHAAQIDRHAWFTKQSSMTLANAAPVWRPDTAR